MIVVCKPYVVFLQKDLLFDFAVQDIYGRKKRFYYRDVLMRQRSMKRHPPELKAHAELQNKHDALIARI